VLIRGDGDAERFHVPKRDTFAAHVPRYTQRERERERGREGGRVISRLAYQTFPGKCLSRVSLFERARWAFRCETLSTQRRHLRRSLFHKRTRPLSSLNSRHQPPLQAYKVGYR